MSKWGKATAKERLAAPANIFCGPGRSFPVADQADVDNAVSSLGRAGGSTAPIKSCVIAKAKANNWTLPQAWMAAATARAAAGVPVASFAIGTPETIGEMVVRRGKIFEAGEYADKDFLCTIEDLVVAASAFVPVQNDLEHTPTILSDKLGSLLNVTLSEDNSELYGEVEIPRWLHDAIGDAPIKSSLSWDRETMQIVGNALVLEPRVSDAALMSAYTAFTGTPPPPATEDAAVGVLATIRALVTGQDPRPSVTPMSDTPHQTVVTPARAQEVPVTEPAVTNLHAVAAISFADSPEFKAMQAQIDALKATAAADASRAATREAEFTRERAGTWADGEVAAFRALPAERDALVAAYVDAATDDSTNPRTVSFSVNGESRDGSRVDALRARHSARAPHTLTAEQVADGTVLLAQRPANTAPAKMSAERKTELLVASGFSANS
jgi:hypothetical protein